MAEKKPKSIVLRLGSRTIECGIEGNANPIEVFNVHHFAERQQFTTDCRSTTNHAQRPEENNRNTTAVETTHNYDLLMFHYLFHGDVLAFDSLEKFKSDLKIHLRRFLTKVFHKCGLSTINAKIILLQNYSLSEFYLDIIKEVMLSHFLVRALVIVPTPIMISIASASSSALVIDIGWNYTSIDVVYDNRVLTNYSCITNRAGCRLHYELLDILEREGFNLSLISFRDVENCIASLDSMEEKGKKEDSLLMCGTYYVRAKLLRDLIKDMFVSDSYSDLEDYEMPIPQIVANLVQHTLPIDLRKELVSCVIFNGRMTCIRGLKAMITDGIQSRLPAGLNAQAIETIGEWQGASIFSGVIKHIKKTEFLREYRNSKV